ncbi:MAG: hypothetical protein ACT4QA_20655 [Panacagrimonas sp.]
MKRSMLALALLLAAGNSWGQSFSPIFGGGNVRGAVATFLAGDRQFRGGMGASSEAFLAGHVTEGFAFGRNAFSGLFVELTDGTRIEFLGTSAERSFNGFYDALLPLYLALDEPAMRLAALGTPITEPLGDVIVETYGGIATGLRNSIGSGRSSRMSLLPPLRGLE